MIELALSIYFGYNNNKLAKRKGQNATQWTIVTVFAFWVGLSIGALILMLFFYKGTLTPADPAAIIEFAQNPLRLALVYFTGIGGYLLIRSILERMPDQPGKTISNNNGDE